jgi:hypothetical protein
MCSTRCAYATHASSRTWCQAFIHPLSGSKGDVELYLARKDPLPLDPALLGAVVFFDSMVLGKLLVPLLLFSVICDIQLSLSRGCAVFRPSSR